MPSDAPITITAAQCRAARALIEWTDVELAQAASVDLQTIKYLEARFRRPTPEAQRRIRIALEEGGVVFIGENGGGAGVRLKFNRPECARSTGGKEREAHRATMTSGKC